jgi:hypothetical protein
MVLVVWRVGDCISVFGGCVYMFRTVDVLVRDYVNFVWAISVLVWLIFIVVLLFFCCVFEIGSADVSSFGGDVLSGLISIVFSGYYYSQMHHSNIDEYVLYIFLGYRGAARIGLIWFLLSGVLMIVAPSSVFLPRLLVARCPVPVSRSSVLHCPDEGSGFGIPDSTSM